MCVCLIKLAGKKQNLDPMWKILNKEVDLGEPTSFDHVYLRCTQRQCAISKDIVDNYRTMFESRISAVRTEKLANKTTQQLSKVSTPCIDDHHFKEEMKSVGELTQVCSQIVLRCLYLVRSGRTDILWSVNISLHDRLQSGPKPVTNVWHRLISYIHHACEHRYYCYVGNTAKAMQTGTVSRL